MHIKQITISNFRSFRQQAEIQPFSAATNAVVGRNGSGKSNLFDAVQFCLLAPRFVNLRQEERQALLHEGSGSAAVNAFVEIVFDNSDHRFALENSDEVVLRRTVGLKKDEFFLQRKRATKNEIQSLLEGAGFSKSNPYFIVQQGKVQDLCTMADPERLRLLKEVAGTVVYDEKKTESLAKMEENIVSIDKIQEILSDIEERLATLQSEKEELTVYQQLDRQRRATEYTLYDKELRKARAALDVLEGERSSHVLELATLHEAAKTTHVSIRHIEADLTAKTNQLRRNRLQLQQLEGDKTASVTTCAKLELDCRELQDAVVAGEEVLKTNQQALLGIEQKIVAAEGQLSETVQPAYEEAMSALQQMTDQRNQAKRTQEGLYAKQGRGRQFSTVAERDTSIQSNVTELQTTVAEKQGNMTEQQDVLSNLRRTVAQESKDITSLSAIVTQQAAGLQSLSKTIDEKKRQRLELVDARKEDWRKTEELHEQVRDARENYHRALSDTRKVMPRATAMGLEALRTIVEQERLVVGEQYFGMLMDNMDLKDARYNTAVEVAAQNSLFHVIVDNDNTAARLMNRLEKDKLGRVTFLPLNKLRVENVQYPENNDVKPLLDLCITYDPKVKAAMQHVFNKKLLARTPELASEWSTKLSMDVITLDGDLCSRKGALTGGFVDVNKSRLRAHATQKEFKATLTLVVQEHEKVNRKAKEVDQSASDVNAELQRLEAKHAELTHMITGKETEVERMQSRIENHKKQVEKVEKTSIPLLEREIAVLEGDIGRLQEEMGTELTASLSDEDRELLKELKQTQADLVIEIESQSEKVSQMGVERQKLTSLLNDNLRRRRLELLEGIAGNEEGESRRRSRGRVSSAAAQSQLKEDLEERQRQFDNATQTKDDIEARVEESRAIEEELRGELISAKNELEQLRSQDMKDMKVLEEAQDKSERLLTKRSMCVSKRETYMQKIQELGSLPPPSELEKFSGKTISDLMKALESVNKKLKKYSHVNKKAYDQYVNFSEQRESLLKRKEELDQGAEKVKELVESLDRQKDEAINRTFRGVSAHFKDVFKELVPLGSGELIMRTAIDDMLAADDGEEESVDSDDSDSQPKKKKANDPNNPDVSLYRGVGIKVQFSAAGENFMMSQLSGGQKALVALALIFAIQRCDPAPFYLFDELDQALDSTYRAAVANLIQRQASCEDNPTQFIVSTFRPELVAVANRCYGISHQNKVSSLHPLSKKDALHFIANVMNEEEAVGDVTSLAPSKATTRMSLESKKRKVRSIAETDDEGDDDEEDDDNKSEEADDMAEGPIASVTSPIASVTSP